MLKRCFFLDLRQLTFSYSNLLSQWCATQSICTLKLVSAFFINFLFFHQMIALQKLWKMLSISSKKCFLFPSFPLFLFVGHCFSGWSKINLKVYVTTMCLNKNPITHFVWHLEKEKSYDTETFYGKIMQKIYSKS